MGAFLEAAEPHTQKLLQPMCLLCATALDDVVQVVAGVGMMESIRSVTSIVLALRIVFPPRWVLTW